MPLAQQPVITGYLRLSDGVFPLSERQIRAENPQMSFPKPFASSLYAAIHFAAPPAYDPITQGVRELAPVLINDHYEQQFEVYALSAEQIAENQARQATRQREAAKQARASAVEAIKVTTVAGNEFDGDEISQTRMARAIIALQATGTPTVTWVLANNTVIQASVAELTEALALAGAAQAAVWVV